ncbi:hypothetical protein GCM10010478_17940 [Streptomyces erythrogriseus]|uniref:Transposase n=3 Tax=Streptomyces TaxID=1883 RepID=A0ABP6J2J2_9ACTN|nr:hypothetical protein GCM10010265_60520 [Streptomyces griseoincarnatus]GGT83259.1 hypothetical protein GCM10010287_66660 [Streptomyces variabilis]
MSLRSQVSLLSYAVSQVRHSQRGGRTERTGGPRRRPRRIVLGRAHHPFCGMAEIRTLPARVRWAYTDGCYGTARAGLSGADGRRRAGDGGRPRTLRPHPGAFGRTAAPEAPSPV